MIFRTQLARCDISRPPLPASRSLRSRYASLDEAGCEQDAADLGCWAKPRACGTMARRAIGAWLACTNCLSCNSSACQTLDLDATERTSAPSPTPRPMRFPDLSGALPHACRSYLLRGAKLRIGLSWPFR